MKKHKFYNIWIGPGVDVDKCVGCGVCTLTCPQETLALNRYERSKPFNKGRELIKTIALENRE
jgi:Fe-S-cluster-containing hydrogenase component 2